MTNTSFYMVFKNMACAALYKMELEGQISDGKYENSRPYDHWRWVCKDFNYFIGSHVGGFYPWRQRKTYNLREWPGYINRANAGDTRYTWAKRVLYYGEFANLIPIEKLDTMMKEADTLRSLIDALGCYIDRVGKENYSWNTFVEEVLRYNWLMKYFDQSTLFNKEIADKFAEVFGTYTMKDLKNDLTSMAETVKTEFWTSYKEAA